MYVNMLPEYHTVSEEKKIVANSFKTTLLILLSNIYTYEL